MIKEFFILFWSVREDILKKLKFFVRFWSYGIKNFRGVGVGGKYK